MVDPQEISHFPRLVSNVRAEAAPSATEIESGGGRLFNASSDDLLGLSVDARVREAAQAAMRKLGVMGTSATRLETALEAQLAKLLGVEAAFLTASPAELVTTLGSAHRATYVEARTAQTLAIEGDRTFSTPDELERLLSGVPALVVSCALHPFEGDLAPLPRYAELAQRRGASLVSVDLRGGGVLGAGGGGVAEHLSLPAELVLVSLRGALAGGGFVCGGAAALIDVLRPLGSSPPVPAMAATQRAIEILQAEPQRRARLFDVAQRLVDGLRSRGFDTGPTVTPWIPLWLGDEALGEQWLRGMFEADVACRGWLARGRSRLLFSLPATVTDGQVDSLLETVDRLGRKLGRPDAPEVRPGTVVLARPGSFVLATPCASRWLAGQVARRPDPPPPPAPEERPLRARLVDAVETMTWRAANLQSSQLRRLLDTRTLRGLVDQLGRGRRDR